jgi:hypothetical protein
MKRFLKRLFHRHVWISDLPLSLDGAFAIMAGLWMPPATCTCGMKYPGENESWDKWIDEKNGKHWRLVLSRADCRDCLTSPTAREL